MSSRFDDWFSVQEATDRLRNTSEPRKRGSLYYHINKGTLPATKVGGTWLIHKGDLITFLADLEAGKIRRGPIAGVRDGHKSDEADGS
jgi:hypothetical protein